jgi:hypothetical protein
MRQDNLSVACCDEGLCDGSDLGGLNPVPVSESPIDLLLLLLFLLLLGVEILG